jgi:hypothetical protein
MTKTPSTTTEPEEGQEEPQCQAAHCPPSMVGGCEYPRCFSPSNIP